MAHGGIGVDDVEIEVARHRGDRDVHMLDGAGCDWPTHLCGTGVDGVKVAVELKWRWK